MYKAIFHFAFLALLCSSCANQTNPQAEIDQRWAKINESNHLSENLQPTFVSEKHTQPQETNQFSTLKIYHEDLKIVASTFQMPGRWTGNMSVRYIDNDMNESQAGKLYNQDYELSIDLDGTYSYFFSNQMLQLMQNHVNMGGSTIPMSSLKRYTPPIEILKSQMESNEMLGYKIISVEEMPGVLRNPKAATARCVVQDPANANYFYILQAVTILYGDINSGEYRWKASIFRIHSPKTNIDFAQQAFLTALNTTQATPEYSRAAGQLAVNRVHSQAAITNNTYDRLHSNNSTYISSQNNEDDYNQRRTNALLGYEQVTDASTGNSYKVDAGYRYNYYDASNNTILQTDDYNNPGYNYSELY